MRLERVFIEGYGPLNGIEARLEPKRLNVVIGHNETGKTSLLAAITAALFGHSSAESEERARPWSGSAHRLSITFAHGAERFRLARDFASHAVLVERLPSDSEEAEAIVYKGNPNPRGRSSDLGRYEELLQAWFGFTDPRLFRETSFVYEGALETEISPEIRHLISGAVETDYQQIQAALLDRLDTLTREHPFDPRARKRTNRSIESRLGRLEELRARRARSETVLHELKSRRSEEEAIESRLLELRADLKAKEQLLANLNSWVALQEELKKMLKRLPDVGVELSRARKARAQVEEIDRRILDGLGYLANAPEEVEAYLLRLGMLRTQRAKHKEAADLERQRLEAPRRTAVVLPWLLAIVLALGAGSVSWLVWRQPLAAGLAALAGLAAGFALGFLLGRNAERARAVAEAGVRVAEENIRTVSQEIDLIEIRVNPYLAGRTIEVVLADVKRYRMENQDRREAAAVIHSLPTPESLEGEAQEIDEAVSGVRARAKLLLQQSPFLAPLRDDPVGIAEAAERLQREITGLQTKIEAEQEAQAGIAKRGGDGDAENLETLEEAITLEEAALRIEERQRDVLILTLEVLRESVLGYQEQHVGRLGERTGAILSRLTGGRYRSVSLDSEVRPTLAMDGRSQVDLGSLSRGARDAFYLALRAALARELAAREPLPLLLDDPLAHLDERRRAELVGFLEELASEIQVVMLTHDRRVLDLVREAHVQALGAVTPPAAAARAVRIRG